MDFDAWCDKKEIYHFKEAFYHHLLAKGHGNNLDEVTLEIEWRAFLREVLGKL